MYEKINDILFENFTCSNVLRIAIESIGFLSRMLAIIFYSRQYSIKTNCQHVIYSLSEIMLY